MATKSRLKLLQDRDAAITHQMRSMADVLTSEERLAFNDDEQFKYDELLSSQIKEVQRSLSVEKEIQEQEKRLKAIPDENALTVARLSADETSLTVTDTVPAIARRHYNLKSFHGPNANMDAYQSGQFFLAVLGSEPAKLYCRDHGIQMLAQNEITNNAGGVLVPDVLSNSIIDLREQYGVFRRYAKNWAMTSDNLTIPRRTSGLTAYFVSDGIATTESQKGWDGVTLVAKELAALVRYPNTLSEDAVINIADDLSGEIAYAFANKEDLCGFIGDGSATYGGIQGVTVIIKDANHGAGSTNATTYGGKIVATAAATAVATLPLTDFEKVVGLLPQYAAANACWFMSRAVFAAGPQRLMDASAGNTNQTLAVGTPRTGSGTDAFGRPLPMFLGYPVVIAQAMTSTISASANLLVVMFGDLSLASAMGSRREIGIDASPHRYFEFRQIGIQGVERFDIVNHDLGNTSTAGPLVGLETSNS